MRPLDAVVHACTTLSLGGFSNHDASFGHFDSPVIEAVAVVFMILAGMNFATHYSVAPRRRHRRPGPRRRPLAGCRPAQADAGDLPLRLRVQGLSGNPAYRHDCGGAAAGGRLPLPGTWQAPCATEYSTPSRLQPPPATRAPTSGPGRWRRRCSSCCWPTSPPAAARPAAASRMMRAITVVKVAGFEQVKLLHSHASQNIKIGERIIPALDRRLDPVLPACLHRKRDRLHPPVRAHRDPVRRRPAHPLLGGRSPDQQHRPRAGPGRPGLDLRAA